MAHKIKDIIRFFLVIFVAIIVSSCQKEQLYKPGGPTAIIKAEATAAPDTIVTDSPAIYGEIIDPDEEDDEDGDKGDARK